MTYTPYFVFENFALESGTTISASTEATGYDADNLLIPHPTVKWRSTTGALSGLYVTLPSERYFDTISLVQADLTRHSNLLSYAQDMTNAVWTESSGVVVSGSTVFFDRSTGFVEAKVNGFELSGTQDPATIDQDVDISGINSTIGMPLMASALVGRHYNAGVSNHFRLKLNAVGGDSVDVEFNLTNGTVNDTNMSGTGYASVVGDIESGVLGPYTAKDTVGNEYTFYRCWMLTTDSPDSTNTFTAQVLNPSFGSSVTDDTYSELLIAAPMLEIANVTSGAPSTYPPVDTSGSFVAPIHWTSSAGTAWIGAYRGNGFLDSPNGLSNIVFRVDQSIVPGFPDYDDDVYMSIYDSTIDNAWVEVGAVVVGRSWSPSGALKQFSIQPTNVTSSQVGTRGGHLYRGSRTPYRKVKMQFDYNSHDDAMEFVRQCRMRGDNTPILFWMENEDGVILKDEWIVYGYIDYTPTVSQIIDKWRVIVQMSEVLG